MQPYSSPSKKKLNTYTSKSQTFQSTEYKAIFCPKCISIAKINIIKENEEIFICLSCEKEHKEKITLDIFLNNYKKYNIKECPQCHHKLNINQLLYCFSCKEIVCVKCKEKHNKTMNKNNKNEHVIERYIIKDRKCKIHQIKINEYYCQTCKKYQCKECIKNSHINHSIVNLYLNVDKIKNKLNTFIGKQQDVNNIELNACNKLVLKVKNTFQHKFIYDNIVSNIKNNIMHTYELNNSNYFNSKNLNLLNKSFFNKNKYFSELPKLAKEFGFIINNKYSREGSKSIKKSEKKKIDVNSGKKEIIKDYINSYEKENIKEINNSPTPLNNANLLNKLNNINQLDLNRMNNNTSYNNQINKSKDKSMKNIIYINEEAMEIDDMSNNINFSEENKSKNNLGPFRIEFNFKDIKENKSKKCYCKIIQTTKKIKSVFCLSHNNIILCYDTNDINKSMSVYKIEKDEKQYTKLNQIRYINVIDEVINHIDKNEDDDILLFCSNKMIGEIKITNHENMDYVKILRYKISNSHIYDNKFLEKDSNLKICMLLSNNNFILSTNDKIMYWKKTKDVINSSNQEAYRYNVQKIDINNNIISIKEIRDNLVVLIVSINEGNYLLFYLDIDKSNNIKFSSKKQIAYQLNPDKNSIKKLNDDYFLIFLKENGFIIINTNKKEITSKIINNNLSPLLYGETRILGDYFYIYMIERKNENELMFKQCKAKINELFEEKKIQSGKEINIYFNFNSIGLLFENNDGVIRYPLDMKNEKFNTKVVIVSEDTNIIIFDY